MVFYVVLIFPSFWVKKKHAHSADQNKRTFIKIKKEKKFAFVSCELNGVFFYINMSRDISHVSILFVNFVRSQTDKTAQFTGANIKPLLGNFHFKKQHRPPRPPHIPRAHTHTHILYIITCCYLWPGPHRPLTILRATFLVITQPSIIQSRRADCFHMGGSNRPWIHIYTGI